MKLQISFDVTDLDKALTIAHQVANHASILEIGTLLLHKYGIEAIQAFRKAFPDKTLLADAKIMDRGKESVKLFAQAGADWITVMAGTSKDVIHAVCTTARDANKLIMLDLLDACSLGQSALEAKSLGVNAVLFHKPYELGDATFLEKWDMVRGNTQLPVFISGRLDKSMLEKIRQLNPDGIVLGKQITDAENPAQELAVFKEALPL